MAEQSQVALIAPIGSLVQTSSFTVPASNFSSSHHFGPVLSIKLQENDYLLWNQQVVGVILAQRVHKIVVNALIPQKFKTTQDQYEGKHYYEYEE